MTFAAVRQLKIKNERREVKLQESDRFQILNLKF